MPTKAIYKRLALLERRYKFALESNDDPREELLKELSLIADRLREDPEWLFEGGPTPGFGSWKRI